MVEVTKGKRMPVKRASSFFCCIVKTMQIFSAISGIINKKVITLITFSIPTKMSKLMKAFFAGICLFFSTLVSCQQKGEDFESVSTDEFATLIADPDIQRLDVRTVANIRKNIFRAVSISMCWTNSLLL